MLSLTGMALIEGSVHQETLMNIQKYICMQSGMSLLSVKSIFTVLILVILFFPSDAPAFTCIESIFIRYISPGANQPSDIDIAENGDVYLVDGLNSRVIVMEASGKVKFSFGTTGSGKGQFSMPLGIDIMDGNVFIADTGNHRIQVFDSKGRFIYMFSVSQPDDAHSADPVDVAASGLNNSIYVSDNDNHRIKVFTQKGKYGSSWGGFGENPGQFRFPAVITVNQYNELLVVDVLNTRVQRFDPFGNFIAEIGEWGVLEGGLFRPKGVAADSANRVFVSDSYTGVIQAFSDLGKYHGLMCNKGELRRFITPVGLAIDKRDRLYVVEMRKNRIAVFQLSR